MGNEETMKSLKKKKLQSVWILCILLAGVFIPNMICEASDKGTIQIEYHGRTEQDKEIVLDQAEFICYHVGNLQEGQWKLTELFENAGVSLTDETSSQRALQAKKLYEYAKKINMQGTVVATDSQGIACIRNLEEGLYLIAQMKNWNKKEVGTFSSAPFLLSVPVRINDKEMWKVVCKPKSEWIPEEEQELPKPKPEENKKPDKPKTGDSKPVEMLMLIVILSVCLVAYLTKKKYDYQTKNKNE